MRRTRRPNRIWLFLPGLALLLFAPARAAVTDPIAYRLHTVYKAGDGSLVTTDQETLQLVPTPLDVDHDLSTGAGGFDVVAQLTIDAGRATLRVTKLPGAAATLPLSVEAILPDPRRELPIPLLGEPEETLRIAFGYDALASTAPQNYDATLAIAGADRVTSFSLDLRTTLPGNTIGVTAEIYDEGANGERLDPIRGRVDYTPVPAVAHFGILSGSDIGPGLGAGQASLDLASDVPTRADVLIEDIQGADKMVATATIDKVPNTMSLVLTELVETGQKTFSYRASGRVEAISVDVKQMAGNAITSDVVLEIEDMALSATLIQDAENHATFQSESPIGVVRAGFASGGAVRFLSDAAYLHGYSGGGVDSLSFQILGLSAAEVGTGDPFVVGATMAPGPFRVYLVDGPATTEAWFRDLPGTVTLSGSPSKGTVSYRASGTVAEVTIDAHDPAGIAGRATDLHLLLRDLPTEIDIDYGEDSSTVSLDANGKTLGLIEVLLTSGPDERLPGTVDGVLLKDQPDRYVVFARVNALQKVVAASEDDRIELTLNTAAARIFKADINQTNSTGDPTYIRATIDKLPASLAVVYHAATGSVDYTGSGPIDEITIDAHDPDGLSGRATTAHVLLRQIPQSLSLGFAPGASSVTIDAKSATLGLIEAQLTSGPDRRIDPAFDGVLFEDLADRYVVFGRVTGLRKITVNQGPPPSLDLATVGGRTFKLDIKIAKPGGIATTTATINALPASVSARFSNATTFAYTASSNVGSLTLDSFDPAGISGRAKELHAVLTSLPKNLDVAADPATGVITLDAKGETLGLLEFQLTSGANDRIDPAFDGILVNDLTDRYVMFARITGLKKVVATQQPQPDVTLETTGGRILKIELNEWNGSKVEYTRGTLDRLVPSVRIRFVESDRQEIFYTASAKTNSIVLDTNSGDRWNLRASIANPLPASVTFCQSDRGQCTGNVRSAGAGAFKFAASEHTTLNVFDCVRPLNSSCNSPANASEFTYVDDWRIRFLEMDSDSDGAGFSGYIYMNTTENSVRHTLTGYLLNENGSGGGFEASFGSGFWADKRKGSWDAWGLFKTKTGSINCSGGTSLSVRVLGIWIGVTSYLC